MLSAITAGVQHFGKKISNLTGLAQGYDDMGAHGIPIPSGYVAVSSPPRYAILLSQRRHQDFRIALAKDIVMITLRLTITISFFIAVTCATYLVHIGEAIGYIGNQEEVSEIEIPEFLASAPRDKYGEMIRLGYKLFTKTSLYAKRYVGNELSCTNCHMDAGRRPLAVPMGPAYVAYPTWRKKDDRVNYFDDRIQQCFRYSLNGIPPALGSIELQALTAYASWLAKGLPMGDQMVKGRGLHQIPNTGRDPNHDRGRTIYKDRCAACHGADGLGTDAAPPLWGMKSYNKGAGMHKIRKMAGFVKKNMPMGDETLTDQEALDVSAYINFQYRPYDPRKGVIGILAR